MNNIEISYSCVLTHICMKKNPVDLKSTQQYGGSKKNVAIVCLSEAERLFYMMKILQDQDKNN